MSSSIYHLLALGDSYTIGESVQPGDSFPAQSVRLLKAQGHPVSEAYIIAKTGWTTDELLDGIEKENPSGTFDFVTLLIGVNNQYRGRSLTEYRNQFLELWKKALHFAGNRASHVIVLSIPDWGVTPYAAGRDQKKIAAEINQFNEVNKDIAAEYGAHYLDIIESTREAANDLSLLAEDHLHPSGKEYKKWAERLASVIAGIIQKQG